MSLSLTAGTLALSPGLTTNFLGMGGTEPYVYEVLPNGAGGTIDADSGAYTAPAVMNDDPAKLYDTVKVTDALNATATARILVGSPLFLLCDIIRKELGLNPGRVWIWDQKRNEPTDSDMFVVIRVLSDKVFGNGSSLNQQTGENQQAVNIVSDIQIHIKSRGPEARERRFEVPMALGSQYSESQREINSFSFGKLTSILDLSNIDGAAIPYEFIIKTKMQYVMKKTKAVPYFDTYEEPEIQIEP